MAITELNTSTINVGDKSVNEEMTGTKKNQVSFMILENKEGFRTPFDSSVTQHSFFAENFLSARTRLVRQSEEGSKLPDLIILQIPFVRREIISFVKWLRSSDEFRHIPVIYNNEFLTSSQFMELEEMGMVDDIMRIAGDFDSLVVKARFLGKVKEKSVYTQVQVSSLVSKGVYDTFFMALNTFMKRFLDVLVSSLLILFLLPVFLLISLAIRIESKGPVIYTSRRAGKGFKVFSFFKFRTMVVDADKKLHEIKDMNLYEGAGNSPSFFKVANDPRVTRVGTFLRNTSLDELPQLFNVLKGDMSLVGNRPLPLYEAATLTTDEWAERFMAPAGMTGLWQIKKRGQAEMSAEERINLDIEYARTNTLMRDLWIMANTPKALMQKTNV